MLTRDTVYFVALCPPAATKSHNVRNYIGITTGPGRLHNISPSATPGTRDAARFEAIIPRLLPSRIVTLRRRGIFAAGGGAEETE